MEDFGDVGDESAGIADKVRVTGKIRSAENDSLLQLLKVDTSHEHQEQLSKQGEGERSRDKQGWNIRIELGDEH